MGSSEVRKQRCAILLFPMASTSCAMANTVGLFSVELMEILETKRETAIAWGRSALTSKTAAGNAGTSKGRMMAHTSCAVPSTAGHFSVGIANTTMETAGHGWPTWRTTTTKTLARSAGESN